MSNNPSCSCNKTSAPSSANTNAKTATKPATAPTGCNSNKDKKKK